MIKYLSQYQMLPYQCLKKHWQDLLQQNLSEETANNLLRREHQNLQQFDEQSRALVDASNVVQFDDTGMRIGK